jgi:hypothetical protein
MMIAWRRHIPKSNRYPTPLDSQGCSPTITAEASFVHPEQFPEAEYDSPDFINLIRSRLRDEMISANAHYFAADGDNEWDPYFVVGMSDGLFLVTFEQWLAKTKEIPRISQRLDMDHLCQFAMHWAQAICYRTEVDRALRTDTDLLSRRATC